MTTTVAAASSTSAANPDVTIHSLKLWLQDHLSQRAADYWMTPGVVNIVDDKTLTITFSDADPMRNFTSMYQIFGLFDGDRNQTRPDLDTLARTYNPSVPMDLGNGLTLVGEPKTLQTTLKINLQDTAAVIYERVSKEAQHHKTEMEKRLVDPKAKLDARPDLKTIFGYFNKKLRTVFGEQIPGLTFYDRVEPQKLSVSFTRPETMTPEQVKTACQEFAAIFGAENFTYHGPFVSTDRKIAFDIKGSERMLAASIMKNDRGFAPVSGPQLN